MNSTLFFTRRSRSGFTLVELLVVIAIIGILASMTLTVVNKVGVTAKSKKAKIEAQNLVTAIESYDSAYGRFPVSQAAQADATATGGDFTYGGTIRAADGTVTLVNNYSGTYNTDNSEVVAILMDLPSTPSGALTVNTNHVKNPRQTKFLTATMTSDPALPGIGPDLVYRDPWGNPYIISMDLNYDDQCLDAFYRLNNVSQPSANTTAGYNGLVNSTDVSGNGDHFQFHGKVMVWSAGPDKKVNNNGPATAGVNKDNILSWQ